MIEFDPAVEFHDEAQDICEEIADEILEEIRRFCPIDTGALLRGYHVEMTERGAEIVNDVDYWEDVEYGTRPHWIPNAFGTGETLPHPGHTAQPHVRPAVQVVEGRRRR